MQIPFVLVEPAGPENLGTAHIRKSFYALNSKIKQDHSEIGFNKNTNIYSRFFERINYQGEAVMNLLHSFCNKFLKKQK